MNGSLFFKDGEKSTHTIELRILPHGEVEVEETFVIELNILSGEMDVDPQASSITLKVFHHVMTANLISPSYCCAQFLFQSTFFAEGMLYWN